MDLDNAYRSANNHKDLSVFYQDDSTILIPCYEKSWSKYCTYFSEQTLSYARLVISIMVKCFIINHNILTFS